MSAPKWDEKRLKRMKEHSRQLNASVRDVSRRRDQAREAMRRAQNQVDQYGDGYALSPIGRRPSITVPPRLVALAEEAKAEYQRLDREYHDTASYCQQYASVVTRLEEYAREHYGYRVPQQTVSIQS